MQKCDIQIVTFQDCITKIQNFIDEFDFHDYSNLHLWVPKLEKRISDVLKMRLIELIKNWLGEFKNWVDSPHSIILES